MKCPSCGTMLKDKERPGRSRPKKCPECETALIQAIPVVPNLLTAFAILLVITVMYYLIDKMPIYDWKTTFIIVLAIVAGVPILLHIILEKKPKLVVYGGVWHSVLAVSLILLDCFIFFNLYNIPSYTLSLHQLQIPKQVIDKGKVLRGMEISPSGKYVSYIKYTGKEQYQLVLQELEGGTARVIDLLSIPAGESKMSGLFKYHPNFSFDEKQIILTKYEGEYPNKNTYFFVYDLQSGTKLSEKFQLKDETYPELFERLDSVNKKYSITNEYGEGLAIIENESKQKVAVLKINQSISGSLTWVPGQEKIMYMIEYVNHWFGTETWLCVTDLADLINQDK